MTSNEKGPNDFITREANGDFSRGKDVKLHYKQKKRITSFSFISITYISAVTILFRRIKCKTMTNKSVILGSPESKETQLPSYYEMSSTIVQDQNPSQ